jgi:hypothetical protein
MPNNPSTDNAAAEVQPAPDTAGLSPTRQSPIPIPQPDPNVQAPQPGAPPQQAAQVDPVVAHHATIGHAISRIAASLEGKQINYESDPDNPGNVRQVVTPRKAGGLWRDILLGSIAGGAAGAESPSRESAIGGAALGARAGLSTLDASQEKRKQVAQQDADTYKKDQDRLHQQAQIAHNTVSNLAFDSRADLYNPSQIASHNSSQSAVKQLALANGGTIPKIIVNGQDINGKADNGGELQKMFTANPMSVMQGPEGFHRIQFQTVDTAGLTYQPGKGYVDAQGKPVDLADRTTHHLVDLPEGAWNKNVTLSAKQINEAAGAPVVDSAKPDRLMSSTFGSIFGLGLKSKQDLNQAHREMYAGPKDENEASQMQSEIDALKTQENPSVEDQQRIVVKQAAVDSFTKAKDAQEAVKAGLKPPTSEEDKQKLRELGKKLTAGTLTSDERSDLIARQQEAKTQGLGSEIISQIGKPPVPAQFPKGANDPAFQAKDAAWGAAAQKKKVAETTASTTIRINAERGTDDEIETAAKALAAGDLTSLSDVASFRGDQKLRVFQRAKAINPNFNTKDVKIKLDTQDLFTKGKQGDQIQSFNTFLDHAGDAARASGEFRRVGSPLINRPLNWLAKNATNDQTYQTFVTALEPVRKEYETFLEGGHALTESDKKAGDVLLSDASTPAQIESALKQMGKTAFFRLSEANSRYKRVMGVDFPDMLGEGAKNSASILGLNKEASQFQSGGRVTGGAGGPTSSSQNAQPPLPTSHLFSISGWQKANPAGDVDAAVAQAKQLGYRVAQ